jgi:pilus assembly protein CpaF
MFAITIRERSGQVYTFHFDKPEVLIGRVKGNDVILPKQNISKRHALVRVNGPRFVIEDFGSTNGTYVNGHRITGAVEIGADDKVYLGDFVMNFVDLSSADASSTPDLPQDSGDLLGGQPVEDAARVHESLPEAEEPKGRKGRAAKGEEDVAATRFDMGEDDLLAAALAEVSEEPANQTLVGSPEMAELFNSLDALNAVEPQPVPVSHNDWSLEPPEPAPTTGKRSPFAGLPVTPPPGPLPRMTGSVVPLPAFELGARTPTSPAIPMEPPRADPKYFEDLAALYRAALRDLRPAVPQDASAMSDTEWAEMEDRVVAFVDGAERRGELAGALDIEQMKRDLIYELAGLGPLEPILDDPAVESIEVNHAAQLFVQRNGRREAVSERFSCQPALAAAVDRLVRATGLVRSPGDQHVEGTLVDGTTVRIVWPPLCPSGPTVLLRKPRVHSPTIDELVERGNITPHAAACLKYLVRSQRSIAICGWPHAGRRTVMNALALLIGKEARLVVCEDGRRLRLPHEHVVRLDAAAHASGTPILDIARKLVPDWLLIGEGAGVDFAALVSAATDEGLPPWIATFYIGQRNAGFLRHAVNALCVRHPGVSSDVGAARIAGAFEGVASFSYLDGKPVLDRVELVGYGTDQLDLTPITWEDLPVDLRPVLT